MELWVRSQDKETLTKVSNIFIDNEYQPKGLYRILDNGLELGRYKTKERALEVLDKIQNILCKISDPDLDNFTDLSKLYIPPIIIYEMPEE